MLRSICLKMSILCVSFVSLAGVASAQGHPGTGPLAPTAPQAQGTKYTDEVLDGIIRDLDPNVMVRNENGVKTYTFKLTRADGLVLNTSVVISSTHVTLVAMVAEPFQTPLSEQQLDNLLIEANQGLKPIEVKSHKQGNEAAIFAVRSIDRSSSDEVFLAQLGNFYDVAAKLKKEVDAVKK